jgi:allantoicase
MTDAPVFPDFTHGTINLASARLGAVGLYSTDEFFAPLSRMLDDAPALWREGVYDDNGKWMDGWESRRKRVPGHDFAVVKLAMPGRIMGFDVDTHYFTGNYPPFCSIDAAFREEGDPDPAKDSDWTEILPKSPLGPSAHHFFENAAKDRVWTHLRLHIYPDGGVARLRVYGKAFFDWDKVGPQDEVDLAYIFNGAKSLCWSDAHYGVPDQMLAPGRGINMGDGWETKRRRGPGHDWAIIRLAHPGIIGRIIVDTAHFKGNFPDTCEIRAANLAGHSDVFSQEDIAAAESWPVLLAPQKLRMDDLHEYKGSDVAALGLVTHVRFAMHPDGGVSRLRLFGTKA